MNHTNIKKLSHYLKTYSKDVYVVLIAITLISSALLILGNTIKELIDHGLSQNYMSSINHSMFIICLCITVFGASSFLRSYYINNLAEKVINLIKSDIIKNLLQREISFFEDYKTSNIISLLTTDMEVIGKLLIDALSFALRNSFMLAGSLVLMFVQSPKLSIIVLTIVPLLMLPLLKLGRYVRRLSKQTLSLQDDIAANILEDFTYIQTLYSFNQQERKIKAFKNQTDQYLSSVAHRLKMRAMFFSITISMILMAITLVIWIGSNDIVTGNLTSGEMTSFIYYAVVVGMSAGGIIEFLGEAQRPLATIERVFEQLRNIPKTHYPEVLINTPSIQFDNLTFHYPSRPAISVVNSISFQVKYGGFIGIVGRSGSGKSTLMQLLLKFYTPEKGKITVDGHDIAAINDYELRNLISYVSQEPSIFSGSIRENIAFANLDASEEEIIEAARISGALEFINSLPERMNTTLGERGVKLSGGQKQRIAISRAILRKTKILLLDEATSALDSESEQLLFKSVRNHMKNSTIIAIAHRISAISDADEILLIERGVLQSQGTHSELLHSSDIYRILCEEQML